MDDAMEVEVHVNSNVNSSNENASSNENVDNSDNDNVTKLKVKHSDCNNTDQDASDVTNSLEGHDDIPSVINDTNKSDVSEINNLHDVKNLDANSSEDHDNTSECNKNDELKSKLNDSDHVGESIDNLSNSNETNLTNSVTEKINTTLKPSTEATVTEDKITEKKIVEKLKENNADKETQDNVSIDTTQDVRLKIEIKEEEEETETKENHEVKKKEESGKKKKGKICVECGKKKKIEFRIHFQGKVHTLCSETCYKQFKTKQSTPKAPVVQPKVLESVKESPCPQCQKNITANQGYYPVVGDIKPLCSEECVRKYQDNNGPPRKCSQCSKQVEDKSCHLSWETMVFCSEDCLGKYQSFLGSHCTCCQAPVQQASLGKYCVCFGSDIRQFCSGSCLDDFKKGLKVCTFCQTDLSAGTEGFLAPVGDKGQFKDFCSQACMERYEVMNNLSKTAPEIQECAHCKKQGSFKIQVPYNDKKYFLCCDNCVAGLRCTLKKTDNVCASCHRFYTLENDVKNNNEQEFKFKLDGLYKFFCSKTCMTTYVLSHRRITQCQFCKVKKYNFDMIEKTDRNIGSQIFCSLNCLSLYRVNVNAASAKSIRCDNCSKNNPAQYHLTMSDGSIRNFCTYTCVLAFQNQFTSVPALTTTSMTRQMTTTVQTLKTTSASNAPIIANVMSLTQARPGAPSAPKPLVPQTLVSVRPPQRQPVAVFTTKPQNSTSTITSPSIGQPSIASSQVMREVIVQPPAPKSVKNKTVSCKPIMQTKGVNAKTPACHKAVQTDENPRPVILPVPIPVYVPTPLHMFSRPVPCPVPFPVPIPIPIIINSSKEPQNQVIKNLKKIQGSVHASSQDELSNTSYKFIDDSNKSQSDVEKQSDDVSNDAQTIGDSADEECENDGESDEPQYYIKQNKSNHKREHSPHKHKKHKKIKLDEEIASEESADTPATEDDENNPSFPSAGSSFSVNFSQPGTSYQQSPPRQNNVFETPNFNFEEDEQTLLKVP